ncbi:unnamed protein product [Rhodiola kirilowii]
MAGQQNRLGPQLAAERAVSVIGFGYDLSLDVKLSACKAGPDGSRLIELDESQTRDLVLPGEVVVPDVSNLIKSDKGERTRFRSDVLSFTQMSEQINQGLSLAGKIPCGMFNSMFGLTGSWQKDAASTKSLAFDGWFISMYSIELSRSHIALAECVKRYVPVMWDPVALAGFIEKYGTHIIVGLKMGGKDVISIKQLQKSALQPAEVQNLLKEWTDEKFTDSDGSASINPDSSGQLREQRSLPWEFNSAHTKSMRPLKRDDIARNFVRRGGIQGVERHNQWLSTVTQAPDVISMSFVPITSLLSGLRGSGFLSHAINLYLRYKPPIEDLSQFLEFQIPRQWAPMYGDLPLVLRRKKVASPTLQFSLMSPRLFVNISPVESGNRPVTGLRLYLEGKKSNHLGIHLQHLSSLPKSFQLTNDPPNQDTYEHLSKRDYFEPVNWSIFSHVCTAPVQYDGACFDDDVSIVTKAWFEVKHVGMKKVLFLRLGFSTLVSSKIRRSDWDGPSNSPRKSGMLSSMLMSTPFSAALMTPPPETPAKVDLNSAVFPGGPPNSARTTRMMNFVDTKETVRGPEDTPGYWVVTGARLLVEGGRICIKGKYSLLTIMPEDTM